MSPLFYYSSLFSLFVLFLPACAIRDVRHAHKDRYYQNLSAQIENFQISSQQINPAKKIIASGYKDILPGSAILCSTKITIEEKINYNDSNFSVAGKTNILIKENTSVRRIKKISEEKRWEVDKDNIFWKIGNGFLKLGILLLGLFGGISISVNQNSGGVFFFSGLFIALIIILLSLPFFLIALIVSNMKGRSHPKDKEYDKEYDDEI